MKRTLALVLALILAAGCIAWAEGELPAPLECGHTEYTETENAALAEDVSGTQILRVCADCGWVTAETVDEPSWAQGRQPYFGLDCGHDAEYETTTQFAPRTRCCQLDGQDVRECPVCGWVTLKPFTKLDHIHVGRAAESEVRDSRACTSRYCALCGDDRAEVVFDAPVHKPVPKNYKKPA